MPSFREFSRKLGSLRNTRKVTKTMKMVSATKFHRALDTQRKARAYAEQLRALFGRVAGRLSPQAHPLMHPRPGATRAALVLLVSSDKGLCGGFNNRLFKELGGWLAAAPERFERVDVSFCGRRGYNFFRTRARVRNHFEGVTVKPRYEDAGTIGAELRGAFLEGKYSAVFLAYNEFKSALTQRPVIRPLLPLQPEALPAAAAAAPAGLQPQYLFEPPQPELLAWMLPRLVDYQIFETLLENAAGEHGARMTAMDNATSNADKVITATTLLRNRARQASITKELIEIISGADALG